MPLFFRFGNVPWEELDPDFSDAFDRVHAQLKKEFRLTYGHPIEHDYIFLGNRARLVREAKAAARDYIRAKRSFSSDA